MKKPIFKILNYLDWMEIQNYIEKKYQISVQEFFQDIFIDQYEISNGDIRLLSFQDMYMNYDEFDGLDDFKQICKYLIEEFGDDELYIWFRW